MFQPFLEFEKKYLPKLKQLKKNYIVAQTYKRANDLLIGNKIPILFTSYGNISLAQEHQDAFKNDKYCCIIDLNNEAQFSKVIEMLGPDSKYKVFWSVVKNRDEMEKYIKKKYFKNLKNYIDNKLKWGVNAYDTVETDYEVEGGELMITLTWRSQKITIKFEDIENS
jgi:hypothetical protein